MVAVPLPPFSQSMKRRMVFSACRQHHPNQLAAHRPADKAAATAPFEHQPLSLVVRLETAMLALLSLALTNLILLAVGVVAFNRYDVR